VVRSRATFPLHLQSADDSIAKPSLQWTRKKRKTEEHLEKKFGERSVNSGFQIQLEEGGDGSTGQSWMDGSGLSPMFYLELTHRQKMYRHIQPISYVLYCTYTRAWTGLSKPASNASQCLPNVDPLVLVGGHSDRIIIHILYALAMMTVRYANNVVRLYSCKEGRLVTIKLHALYMCRSSVNQPLIIFNFSSKLIYVAINPNQCRMDGH